MMAVTPVLMVVETGAGGGETGDGEAGAGGGEASAVCLALVIRPGREVYTNTTVP